MKESSYLITFELGQSSNKDGLIMAIKKYGTWARITNHAWAVVTSETSRKIRDNLIQYIGTDGRLFVLKSAAIASWRNAMCTNEWLKENI